MMTLAQMQEAITKLTQDFVSLRNENEALRRENEALRCDNEALRMDNDSIRALSAATHNQYLALAESTKLLIAERDELKKRVSELEAVNKKLTDMLWGRRSERRIGNNETPFLDFGDDLPSLQEMKSEALPPDVIIAQAAAQNALDLAKLAELKARREARRARQQEEQSREALPGHLERREVVLDLPEDQKEGLKLFTTKITERLRFEKPTVYVERILRRVYARTTVTAGSNESAIVAPPPPPAIVEGCKYDYSIIAAIACMKLAFYMSTYREQNFFGQSGWYPSRSTLNELLNYAVNSIVPLFAQMEKCMMDQSLLFGDATEITVLLRGELAEDEQVVLAKRKKDRHKELEAIKRNQRSKGLSPVSEKQSKNSEGSARSYAWLYSGSDAPNELMPNPDIPPHERPPPNFADARWRYAPYNIFYWSLTQQHSVIDGHLAKFRGTFVGDATGANANLAARNGDRLIHQSCNTHARRYFTKALTNEPILASQMVAMYRQLYAVEYRGAMLSAPERLELRQREAVPIWKLMEKWLELDSVKAALPKSSFGEAVTYLRNQWNALRHYLTDGNIPIDNNHSERAIRPLTIGRKNWMFLGSKDAAPGRMKLFSIVSSAQRHCLSIQDYLEDVFLKLSQAAQHSPQDLELGSPLLMSLLPDRWAATHPQHVQHERLAEKRQVAEDKQYYRLQAGLAGTHPYASTAGLPSPE